MKIPDAVRTSVQSFQLAVPTASCSAHMQQQIVLRTVSKEHVYYCHCSSRTIQLAG